MHSSSSSSIVVVTLTVIFLLGIISAGSIYERGLSCYCNHDGGVTPCIDFNATLVCQFDSIHNFHNGSEDFATCTAAKHPIKGIYYSCAWGSVITERECGVRVDHDLIPYDFCRCNTKNFCNEDFFEDEIDETAVDTAFVTEIVEQTTMPPTLTVDNKLNDAADTPKEDSIIMTKEIETTATAVKNTPSIDASGNSGRAFLIETKLLPTTTVRSKSNNDFVDDDNFSTESEEQGNPPKLANMIADSKKCIDCDSIPTTPSALLSETTKSTKPMDEIVEDAAESNAKKLSSSKIVVALTIIASVALITFVNSANR